MGSQLATSYLAASTFPLGDRATLAHDLRGPLSAIALGLEWLLEPGAEGDAPHSTLVMDVVRRNIRLMDEIVAGESGSSDDPGAGPAAVDVLAVVNDVAALYSPILRKRGQRVAIVNYLADDPVTHGLTRVELKRVVLNMLDNAAKFAPAGDELRIELRRSRDGFRLSVVDHGPGIAPTERRLVFTSGYRVAGTGGDVAGLGFGLAYLAKIVGAAGGHFGVRRNGRETSVWFTVTAADDRTDALTA